MTLLIACLLFLLTIALCHGETNTIRKSLMEELPNGTFVANIKEETTFPSVPAASLSSLRFSFPNSGSWYRYFGVNEISGEVRTTSSLDREELCQNEAECMITLRIKVTPPQFFHIVILEVQLNDTNDNSPEFSQSEFNLDIPENTPLEASFSLPAAIDRDVGQNGVQRYIAVFPSTSVGRSMEQKFRLNVLDLSEGGKIAQLQLISRLDRELEQNYRMSVVAIDGGSQPRSGSLTVRINVSDFNDHNPQFSNETYYGTVYENSAVGTSVLQLHAEDRDVGQNGVVRYGLQSEDGAFEVDEVSGVVRVKGDVDYERTASYRLQATAHDLGANRLTTYAIVAIDVLDINDEKPMITVNTRQSGIPEVLEHSNISSFVAYITVSDPDSGNNGEFECAIDNSNFHLARDKDYTITTNKVFDREEISEYSVTMSCTDKGSPPLTQTETITIYIKDINDNYPQLDAANYRVSFKENNTIGAVVTCINASDDDAGQNAVIRYDIDPLGDNGEVLRLSDGMEYTVNINPTDGCIRANIKFDYEIESEYKFLLTATDHGVLPKSSTATMTLTIQDVNDEWPYFDEEYYQMSVSEGLHPYTYVGNVTARDKDSPPHNTIIYTIKPSSDYFRIARGIISTTRELDREQISEHHLQIVASNPGASHINATVNVSVRVIDVNDNAPVIKFPSQSNNTVQMPAQVEVGFFVANIDAMDYDLGENGRLQYSISRGNDDSTFTIDENTGAIRVAAVEGITNKKMYYLQVTVSDCGQSPQVAFEDLNINVNKTIGAGAAAKSGFMLVFQGSNLVIFISVISGTVLIIVIIVVAVLCVRAHRRHVKKRHNYNCRMQESKKGKVDVNFDTVNRNSDSSCDSATIAVEGRTVENGHLGTKTKEKAKKEVTFSLDQDDTSTWPLHAHPKQFENPHANSTEAISDDLSGGQGHVYSVHGADFDRKSGGKDGFDADAGRIARSLHSHQPQQQQQQHHHHHHHHHHHVCRHHRRMMPGPSMMYGSDRPMHHLTQGDLEMHDMLNNSVDHESECSCSGSITDSGRGPSEEGDNTLYAYPPPVVDPYYGPEPRSCCLDIPISDTILEEAEDYVRPEAARDASNLEHAASSLPSVTSCPSRHCSLRHLSSRSSVDNQSSNRCAYRLRHPLKNSNEHMHSRQCFPSNDGLSISHGSRSPVRSSLESVSSAPGRMDVNSARKPKRFPSECSDMSQISGVYPLVSSDETLPDSVSKDGLVTNNNHLQHCVHTPRELKPGRVPEQTYKQGANQFPCEQPDTRMSTAHQLYLPSNQTAPSHGFIHKNHPYGYTPSKQADLLGTSIDSKEAQESDNGSEKEILPELQTPPAAFKDPPQSRSKGVRFAEPCHLEVTSCVGDRHYHDCFSADCTSDDGTSTSGSYCVETSDLDRRQPGVRIGLPGPDEGTCV